MPPIQDEVLNDRKLEIALPRGLKLRNPLGLANGIHTDPRVSVRLM